nr:retrovirus-related Pol polyprotein from transposon TNT 1-94 [Tanacetum cinerariifolium]
IWCDIIKEMDRLATQGIDLVSMMQIKIGNVSHPQNLTLQRNGFYLKGYSYSGYVGCNMDRKSTLAKAEYVAAVGCCASILWMKSQLSDYDINYKMVTIFCDNIGSIAISNNPVLHSRTKHIDIRCRFIRDHILKEDIELHFIPTEYQLADIFTKPLDEPTFTRLKVELGMLNIDLSVSLIKDV